MDGDRYVINQLINKDNLAFFISGERNVGLSDAIESFKTKNKNNLKNFLQVNKVAFEKIKFLIYHNSYKKHRIVKKIEKTFYNYLYITERLLNETDEEYAILVKKAKADALEALYPNKAFVKNKLDDIERFLISEPREKVSIIKEQPEVFPKTSISNLLKENADDPSALEYIKQSLQLGGNTASLKNLLVGYFNNLGISFEHDEKTGILSAIIENQDSALEHSYNNSVCKLKKKDDVFINVDSIIDPGDPDPIPPPPPPPPRRNIPGTPDLTSPGSTIATPPTPIVIPHTAPSTSTTVTKSVSVSYQNIKHVIYPIRDNSLKHSINNIKTILYPIRENSLKYSINNIKKILYPSIGEGDDGEPVVNKLPEFTTVLFQTLGFLLKLTIQILLIKLLITLLIIFLHVFAPIVASIGALFSTIPLIKSLAIYKLHETVNNFNYDTHGTIDIDTTDATSNEEQDQPLDDPIPPSTPPSDQTSTPPSDQTPTPPPVQAPPPPAQEQPPPAQAPPPPVQAPPPPVQEQPPPAQAPPPPVQAPPPPVQAPPPPGPPTPPPPGPPSTPPSSPIHLHHYNRHVPSSTSLQIEGAIATMGGLISAMTYLFSKILIPKSTPTIPIESVPEPTTEITEPITEPILDKKERDAFTTVKEKLKKIGLGVGAGVGGVIGLPLLPFFFAFRAAWELRKKRKRQRENATPIIPNILSVSNIKPILYPIYDFKALLSTKNIQTTLYPLFIEPTITIKIQPPLGIFELLEREYRKAVLVEIANNGRYVIKIMPSVSNIQKVCYPINDCSISFSYKNILSVVYPLTNTQHIIFSTRNINPVVYPILNQEKLLFSQKNINTVLYPIINQDKVVPSLLNIQKIGYPINDYKQVFSSQSIKSVLYPLFIPPNITIKIQPPLGIFELLEREYRKAVLVEIANNGRYVIKIIPSVSNIRNVCYPINDCSVVFSYQSIKSVLYPIINQDKVVRSVSNIQNVCYPINDCSAVFSYQSIKSVLYPLFIPPNISIKIQPPLGIFELLEREYRKAVLVEIANNGRYVIKIIPSVSNIQKVCYPINDCSVVMSDKNINSVIYPIINQDKVVRSVSNIQKVFYPIGDCSVLMSNKNINYVLYPIINQDIVVMSVSNIQKVCYPNVVPRVIDELPPPYDPSPPPPYSSLERSSQNLLPATAPQHNGVSPPPPYPGQGPSYSIIPSIFNIETILYPIDESRLVPPHTGHFLPPSAQRILG